MTRIKLSYVNEYRDVRGKLRRYFRRPGFKRVALPGIPGSEEFMRAYQAALDQSQPLEIGAGRTEPGTIDALIVDYFKSDAFTKALAPETQRMRRNILDRFRSNNGKRRVATLDTKDVARLLGNKPPYVQKNWLKTLRGLMLFAVAENYRVDDPTAGVKAAKPALRSKGHMTWGSPEIAAYRGRHPLGTTARIAIELLLNVAARRGDAHTLGVQHIKDGKITWRPKKTARSTGKALSIRILPELQAAIDAMPARDTALAFVLNDYGRPFATAGVFGNKFALWCKQAGLTSVLCADGRTRNYRAHGLRKAALVALAHAGCTGPELMSVSGHTSLAQVQVYIEEAEQGLMADAAIAKLEARKRTASD
jgi:integrase/recombinase XerD